MKSKQEKPLTSSRAKKVLLIRLFHLSEQKIFSFKSVVSTLVAEFDLVKKCRNNVKSFVTYAIIIKHAIFSCSSIEF